jgi:glycosyltransferase involved in cell wall biosynthesis
VTLLAEVSRANLHARRLTRPVRVCFVIDRLSRAGTETQLLALVKALDRGRVEPFLCLLDGEDQLSRSLEPVNCPTLRLGLQALVGRATLPALGTLKRFWRSHHIDVVQTYFLDSTYLAVPWAKLCGIKKIIRVRNNLGYWLTNGHQRLGRWMGRLADVTLTNSDGGKQAIMEAERLHPEKIAVLENGVDLECFAIGSLPDTRGEVVRVGAVANLRPVKNIDGLIRAAASLRETLLQVQFEVAGEGEQRHELEKLIADHRLAQHFRLLGSVSDIPAFLMRQDIAILPSHSEGMSNALLEYMASGRMIVATDVGAASRLIRDGIHGRLVPPGDEAALAAAIAWMIQNPEAGQAMAMAARQRVQDEYSRSAMARRFEAFYETLISRRAKGSIGGKNPHSPS